MVARGLPCSMSLISRFRTAQPWGMKTTWSEVRNWNRNGVEIWSHGTNHKNYTLKKFGSLYDEVVNSKKEIEAQNIKVVGFVLPGVAPIPGQAPLYNGLLKPSDYNSTAGKLLMQTYAITEAYAYKSSTRILPTYIYHGLNHYTVSDGLGSLANAESLSADGITCHLNGYFRSAND